MGNVSRSPFRPDPTPPGGKHHVVLVWSLGLIAVGGGVSTVLWAPPDRATLLLSLAGLILTTVTAWRAPRGRR